MSDDKMIRLTEDETKVERGEESEDGNEESEFDEEEGGLDMFGGQDFW